MKILSLLFLGLIGLIFISFNLLQPLQGSYTQFTSQFSILAILATFSLMAYCCIYTATNFDYAKKTGMVTNQILLLPSSLIPVIIVTLNLIPTIWSIIDRNFNIDFASYRYLNNSIILSTISYILLLIGMSIGKQKNLSRLIKQKKVNRELDVFLNSKKLMSSIMFMILIIAVIAFCINISLRFDLILEGGRGYKSQLDFWAFLLPMGYILSTIATVISGLIYAKSQKKIAFIVPILDILPRMIRLSRAFYLPFIFFIVGASLLGTNLPIWLYWWILPLVIIFTQISLTARGVSSGGLSGLFSGLQTYRLDFFSSIRNFMETNSTLGVNSNVFAFRDHSQSFFEGLTAWLTALSPIPSFINPLSIPGIHELKRLGGIKIPMPVVSEPYYLMGWFGVVVFLFIGWWIGRVEGNLIFHTRVYGKAYWPHVLIWISMLYGVILSFHSGIRACSRPLLYSILFIWLLKAIVSYKRNKNLAKPTKISESSLQQLIIK